MCGHARISTEVRNGCAPCQGGAFQWVQGPPGDSLQPEAIGAVMEVTKWLKPSISVSRIGDSASVQAATRVNAEQASKMSMCRPTRRHAVKLRWIALTLAFLLPALLAVLAALGIAPAVAATAAALSALVGLFVERWLF